MDKKLLEDKEEYCVEVCVDSVESAIAAYEGGATRIELCSNLIVGGTTPGIALYEEITKYINIPINVLIRPRCGDFCYSDYEYNIIIEEVKKFRNLGANGIVIGILKEDGNLDKDRISKLIEMAQDMEVTLHRAFDMTKDMNMALKEAIELGVDTVLTSGGKNNSLDGVWQIKELVNESQGKIDILVGGGVNDKNIIQLAKDTGAKSFHLSAKKMVDSNMKYRKNEVSMGIQQLDEYTIYRTDKEIVSRVVKLLNEK